jgi:hypothetical protein
LSDIVSDISIISLFFKFFPAALCDSFHSERHPV